MHASSASTKQQPEATATSEDDAAKSTLQDAPDELQQQSASSSTTTLAAVRVEEVKQQSEKKVRRRKKSKTRIERKCFSDTDIDVVVVYGGLSLENSSDHFLVETPMSSAAVKQLDSAKAELLSTSEPAPSASVVQSTHEVFHNIDVLRCYVVEKLMFPISFLVQASAHVQTSADEVQSGSTAADIFVSHLHAKVFTVVSSSTVWDPGGFFPSCRSATNDLEETAQRMRWEKDTSTVLLLLRLLHPRLDGLERRRSRYGT